MTQKFTQKPKAPVTVSTPRPASDDPISTAQYAIWMAIFFFALCATVGSLYFSTYGDPVKNLLQGNLFPSNSGFEPCLLCWFARILMYPMLMISAVGIVKKDHQFTDYLLPMSILGIFLDTYHYALQMIKLANPFTCTLNNPCDAIELKYLGFITIPFMALSVFTAIFILCLLNNQYNRRASNTLTPKPLAS